MLPRLAIVGVGMMGGSVALAARRAANAQTIYGVDQNPDHLAQAIRLNAIDQGFSCLEEVPEVDLVVLAMNVDGIVDFARRWQASTQPGSLITDLGSTKGLIVDRFAQNVAVAERFVGAHPIAGSQRSGPVAARADLFMGCVCAICPTGRALPGAIAGVEKFWQSLGCRTRSLNAAEHDTILARTSHLPHLVANALMLQLEQGDTGFVSTGLRDTTRIAGSDAQLWLEIFRQNRGPVADAARKLATQIDRLADALENAADEELLQHLQTASQRRRNLDH